MPAHYSSSLMMKNTLTPQGETGNFRCSDCGHMFSSESSATSRAVKYCPACGERVPWTGTLHGSDGLTDDWLEGERAGVRSRRPYGEPRFR
jgi:NAD-dependent SIR2 family protein deacetylase